MRTPIVYIGTASFALLFAIFLSFPRVEAYYVNKAQASAADTGRLVTQSIDQTIARYRPLPQLIADDPFLKDLLRQSNNSGLAPFLNEKLRLLAKSVGASDIYLMDRDGLTIAASNYREPNTFLGRNFSYRPYFISALNGEIALFHGFGVTSRERGFFFAAPVLDGIKVIGVMAIKVTASDIEQAWALSDRGIIVSDPNNIVFLTNRTDYRMKSLTSLTVGQLERIADTRQFPMDMITPLASSASLIETGIVELDVGPPIETHAYLSTSAPLSFTGWNAIVLTPFAPIRWTAIAAVAVLALILTLLTLVFIVIHQRRARLLDRMHLVQEQRAVLEEQVSMRTADLDATNVFLRSEIAERKLTETQLRKSQRDLVQAGKLAALGKMSAALSHELNQPLGAMKSYAYNATQFLERGQHAEAGANITHISEMVDRMTKISKHLRGFARRPGDQLKAIPVGRALQDAVDLSGPQMREKGISVSFKPPYPEIYATGGALRLQQVIINLLNNAADAMVDTPCKKINISLLVDNQLVNIEVRDVGPGLDSDAINQVFDAFYTTKDAGVGMGLGLSISYNIVEDFGGSMSVMNHPEGGAVFTVTLKRSPSNLEAGE